MQVQHALVRITADPWGGVVRNKVTCKQMQQLSAMLGAAMHRGKDTAHKTCCLQGDHG